MNLTFIQPVYPFRTWLFSFMFLMSSLSHAANFGALYSLNPLLHYNKSTYYKKNEHSALIEGDIIMGKIDYPSTPRTSIPFHVRGQLWPQGMIPFEIDQHLPLANKKSIDQAIELWQKNTNLKFVKMNPLNRKEFKNYIYFTPNSNTACASSIGMQGGKQNIVLASRCKTMSTAHEIGHALGLWHEHTRRDRNHYIRIIWENIREDHLSNFKQHLNNSQDFGEYDYESIMHYSPFAFSKNGKPTIIPLVQGVHIGQREKLSEKDLAAINTLYPALATSR